MLKLARLDIILTYARKIPAPLQKFQEKRAKLNGEEASRSCVAKIVVSLFLGAIDKRRQPVFFIPHHISSFCIFFLIQETESVLQGVSINDCSPYCPKCYFFPPLVSQILDISILVTSSIQGPCEGFREQVTCKLFLVTVSF